MIEEQKALTKNCPFKSFNNRTANLCQGSRCMLWFEFPSTYRKSDEPCACAFEEGITKEQAEAGCEVCDYTGFALLEITRGNCGMAKGAL